MEKDLILKILDKVKKSIESHPTYYFISVYRKSNKKEVLYLASKILLKKVNNYIILIENDEINNFNDFIMEVHYMKDSLTYQTFFPIDIYVSDYIYADLTLIQLLGDDNNE